MSGWQTRDPSHVGLDPADYTPGLAFPKLNEAGDGFEPATAGRERFVYAAAPPGSPENGTIFVSSLGLFFDNEGNQL